MDEQIRFTLTDSKGKPHRYLVDLHPPTEGQAIVWALLAAAAEPIGRIAADVITSDEILAALAELRTGEGSTLDDPAALKSVLSRLDFARLGADVRAVLTSKTIDMPELSRALLRYTMRDDKPLDDPNAFNDAYRGNYGELLSALLRIVRENGFFPVSGIF